MRFGSKIIAAVMSIIVGVLFITMKGEVVSIALTVLGVALIAMGILDLVKEKNQKSSITKIVAGALAIVFGWLLVKVALYVVAVLLIIYCGMDLFSTLRTDGYPMSAKQVMRTYAKPVIGLIAGICLLFNQGGTVAWVFILTGIVFIAEGCLMLYESKK